MKLIYATGQPREMEFGVVTGELKLPAGATVFAVCEGERTENRLDEHTFGAMSDPEYYRLQSLINAARLIEIERARRSDGGLFGDLLERVFDRAA